MWSSDRAREELDKLLGAFESGQIPAVIEKALLTDGSRPCDKWSFHNRILMVIQGTGDARGFRQWREVSRHVKAGSKAIYILAPVIRGREEKTTDPATGEETTESVDVLVGFRGVPVFRLEDTDGAPLPDLAPPTPPPLMDVAARFGVRVEYAGPDGVSYGFFNARENRVELHTHHASTWFHELAHAAHHRVLKSDGTGLCGGQDWRQEIVAELTAGALMRVYQGNGEYDGTTYRYIARYARESGRDVMRAVMDVLRDVDRVLREILGAPTDAPTTTATAAPSVEAGVA